MFPVDMVFSPELQCQLIPLFFTTKKKDMLKYEFLVIFLFVFKAGVSQSFTISGYVEDVNTGERIIGAYVIDSISNKITQSNNYGFYTIRNLGSKVSVHSTFIGLKSESITITIKHDTTINIKMQPVKELKEVVISSSNYYRSINSQLGAITIPVKTITTLPALGEPDILKAIQSQPGIKGGMEGSAGVFVRGGSGGENLFLLDDVPMYNVSHLYGFFSAFNSNAIKDVKIFKGCFPARYGGRASSVIDIRSLDGNNKSLKGEFSLGFISSNITLEGPLFSPKTTFIISARRSYMELYSDAATKAGILGKDFPSYYFYDLNARLSHTFSQRDKISISLYKGQDHIQNKKKSNITNGLTQISTENIQERSGWGNIIGSLRWNHTFRNDLFSNTTIAYSNYDYYTQNKDNTTIQNFPDPDIIPVLGYNADYRSDISDLILKTDFDYTLSDNSKLLFGAGNTFHTYNPGKNSYDVYNKDLDTKYDTSYTNSTIGVSEYFFYIEDEYKVSEKLKVDAGIRFSGLLNRKPSFNIEPRFSANYTILPQLVIKAGYSRMTQYMHLLSTSGLTMPTDLWVPAMEGLKPLKSDQVDIGFAYNAGNKVMLSVEEYRKWFNNTTDLRSGSSLFTEFVPWYEKTIQGKGNAWGIEFSFEKQLKKLSVSINYTLSRSFRINHDLNNGIRFPFKYDRIHDLNISLNYKFSEKWDFSAMWIFGTGYPVTLPVEKYKAALGTFNSDTFSGGQIDYYPSLNNCRLPAYHRLDLGFHRKTTNRLGDQILSLNVFNAYNRQNPVSMYAEGLTFGYNTLLPIIPTITYTLKFK
jgi:outer membrane receptor for ferrienterochelin and colicin